MNFIQEILSELYRKFYYIMMKDEDLTTFILLCGLLMSILSIIFLEIAHLALFFIGTSTIILNHKDV